MSSNGWIGVDLDGTLAEYDEWKGARHIGKPVPAMVERVKQWIADGIEVRIFTARVSTNDGRELHVVLDAIDRWWRKHVHDSPARVTNKKDYGMIECWDDRSVVVERNTGRVLGRNP